MYKNSTILVADDDKFIRDRLETLLDGHGFVILKARNGEEALTAIKNGSVDLVILDIHMEGISGIDILQGAKNMNIDVPFIVITGDETMDTERRARECGVYAYFTKPIELEIFKKTVLSIINRRERTA